MPAPLRFAKRDVEHASILAPPPSRIRPSSEKYDMSCPKSTTSQIHHDGVVIDMSTRARMHNRVEPPFRCVSSGYMSGGGSCPHVIPADVVRAAWEAELARRPGKGRLFQFAWRGHTWLAFGLDDGEIRGVYCPSHRAEREARFAGCEAQHYAPAAAIA